MRDRVVEIYRDLVAGFDGVDVKGTAMAYTSMNGNIFSFVDGDGVLCIRLSDEDQLAFKAAHGTGEVVQHGSVMKGYVPVPAVILVDKTVLRAVFGQALRNAGSLKPKATKRKKTAKVN